VTCVRVVGCLDGPLRLKMSRIGSNSSLMGHEDTLRCEADGNPSPKYTWLNANTGETLHRGQQLTFDACRHLSQGDQDYNETISLRCVATVSGFHGTHSHNVTATFSLDPRAACGLTFTIIIIIIIIIVYERTKSRS